MDNLSSLTSMKSMINDISLKRNSMKINDSLINKSVQAKSTELLAERLVEIFNAPQSRKFFLKCAWHLSEDQIWTAVENSKKAKVKSPVKYFVKCCNNQLNS